jgi:peptidoglycan hydrolase-like protein with peptidoglycan-binding domain
LPQDNRWLQSLRASRARRFAALRKRRRRTTYRTMATVMLASLTLASAGAVAAQAPATKLLKRGSSGSLVVSLQTALGIPADGIFGPATKRAVKRFQRRNGLLVDGIAGPQTLAALGIARSARAGRTGGGSLLRRIALCESGGNPAAVSPDGRYRGKYQFSRATWRALGGTGDPAQAPEALQDRLAAKLLAQSGTAPWPNCP